MLSQPFAAEAKKIEATAATNGSLHLEADGKELCGLTVGLFDENWNNASASAMPGGGIGLKTKSNVDIKGSASYEPNPDGGVKALYEFTPVANVTLNSLNVSADFPIAALAGTKWVADDQDGTFPAEHKETGLRGGPVKKLTLNPVGGPELRFAFDEPTEVLLQDNRQWNTQTFSVRIGTAGGRKFAAGEKAKFGFTLASSSPLELTHDGVTTLTAGPEWIALKTELDVEPGSALDFSGMNLTEAPAGKYGRVICRNDGQFVFEKDLKTARRFYGVNICFGAQYLSHEQADKLAERFARIGYNALRIHHYEGQLTQGKPSTELNEQSIEQLDYLLAAMAKKGVYITTDLFVSRPVKFKDIGIDKPGNVGMDEFKIMVPVVPAAWENWKKFARVFLEHTNPHSKLRYADDPALAWLSMINEGCFGNFTNFMKDIPEWKTAWNEWLAQRYTSREKLAEAWGNLLKEGEDPAKGSVEAPADVYAGNARSRDVNIFLAAKERDMVVKMKTFLREEIHCQALVTNSNAWTNHVTDQYKREVYDYIDDHFYVDHPQFLHNMWQLPSRCDNNSPIKGGATGGRGCCFTRIFGKPFTITEYNYAGPGRFRGVGGILTGAMGALQGWSGIWRFAYSHDPNNLFAPGKIHYFDMVCDPLSQAAERASICLFLRGDMQMAPNTASIVLKNDELLNPPAKVPKLAADWHWAAWVTRIGTTIEGVPNDDPNQAGNVALLGCEQGYGKKAGEILELLKKSFLKQDNLSDPAKSIFRSQTGEIFIDAPGDMMILDTPKTAGGYAKAGATIMTHDGSLRIGIQDSDATVWISALDNAPISSSKRMLVTHLTDLQNSEIKYAEKARKTLLDWGKLPHLVRSGKATVTVKLANPGSFEVWSLSTSGKRLNKVATKSDRGALEFTADVGGNLEEGARMMYEVVGK